MFPPDDPPESSSKPRPLAPGPGQFSLRTLALITFDCAFLLGWWANCQSATPLGASMSQFTGYLLTSTLRVGIVAFPFWTLVFSFFPALAGAALGSCAMADVARRREVRGASLFWTLLSAVFVEFVVRIVIAPVLMDPDGHLLFIALGNLGCAGLGLLVYAVYLAMISAGYGIVIALTLSLLGRWRMIPLAAPWKDAPWRAMGRIGLYAPFLWLTAFFLWALAGEPTLFRF